MPLLLADFIHSRRCKPNLRKNVDTTGKQETIIQHIEIVKQRGQAECLTPLLLPIFDSLSGKFGREDLFFLRLPCASSKKRCTHRMLTSSKAVWTYALEALVSLRRVHPFLLDAREAT